MPRPAQGIGAADGVTVCSCRAPLSMYQDESGIHHLPSSGPNNVLCTFSCHALAGAAVSSDRLDASDEISSSSAGFASAHAQ
jgi:hypothetical protein